MELHKSGTVRVEATVVWLAPVGPATFVLERALRSLPIQLVRVDTAAAAKQRIAGDRMVRVLIAHGDCLGEADGDLLDWLHTERPEIRLVLMLDDSDDADLLGSCAYGVTYLVPSYATPRELSETVGFVLSGYVQRLKSRPKFGAAASAG